MVKQNRMMQEMNRRISRLTLRRFHGYCIGAAKTGTTSIASMFSSAYQARHEPQVMRTNRLVIDYLEGVIDEGELRAHLLERDKRLWLELESAHPLGYVAGVLTTAFPEARFIVTVREPLSWLGSRLNFHYSAHAPAWAEYRNYFWTQRHKGFASEEAVLERYRICSLDTYLSQYADHYRRVLAGVPEERRIVVRTSEIDQRMPEIAKFLGADPDKITTYHKKRSNYKITPLTEIDSVFVKGRIMHYCEDLIEMFFPERIDFYKEDAG